MFLWPPMPVVLPLFMAAVIGAAGHYLPRRVVDAVAWLVAATVCAICCMLTLKSSGTMMVYWYGAWKPFGHLPLGIAFTVDPIGAALAALTSFLVLCAFTFSWEYFEDVRTLYHVLMLVFLAGMCGMCLTGDLFNMFVWFELMSAAGVALCGYKAEETGPLQGAINFSISNTVGAFLSLSGVAMVYARTGALNFAGIANALQHHPTTGPFIPIVFVFIIAGFMVKAAAFPFHFWLDDAHAVAPTPVCILFSGVMVEIGLYAAARVYWVIFSVPLHEATPSLRAMFLTIGTCTALVGGVMAFNQRHVKRLLAFSTISHVGLMIIGFALLAPRALAGAALYVLGHAMVKGSLFICAGILLDRFGSVDEFKLQGVGRDMPKTGLLMVLGAIGLCGVPPFATFFGEGLIEKAASKVGVGFVPLLFVVCGALTGGAVLRIAGRIFMGWGEMPSGEKRPEIAMQRETRPGSHHAPVAMWLPAVGLLVVAALIGWFPSLRGATVRDARWMTDSKAYVGAVVYAKAAGPGSLPAPANPPIPAAWYELLALVLATALALGALFPFAAGQKLGQSVRHTLVKALLPLRELHSGKIGDYIAWFTFGIGAYAAWALLR